MRDFVGAPEEESPELYALASPITHVSSQAAPFLLIHGTDDWIVPVAQSRAMRDALRAHGAEARLLELRGAGHVLGPSPSGGEQELVVLALDPPEAWIAIDDFLADTIGVP